MKGFLEIPLLVIFHSAHILDLGVYARFDSRRIWLRAAGTRDCRIHCSFLLRQKTNDAYADHSTGKGRQDAECYSLKYLENDKADTR